MLKGTTSTNFVMCRLHISLGDVNVDAGSICNLARACMVDLLEVLSLHNSFDDSDVFTERRYDIENLVTTAKELAHYIRWACNALDIRGFEHDVWVLQNCADGVPGLLAETVRAILNK